MATGRLPDPNSSPLTAKGDLYTYSTVPAKLAVGSNGETLVADSSTSTGLRYNPQVSSGKNFIINGGMDIWQRGTSSYALTTTIAYGNVDRFAFRQDTTAAGTVTQVTSSLPEGFRYGVKVQRNNGATTTGLMRMCFALETDDSIPLANKTVTLSFWAKAGANYSSSSSALNINMQTGTGTDQSVSAMNSGSWTGQTSPSNTNVTLTTSWQRFSITFSVGSTATQLGAIINYTPVGTAGADDSFSITGLQLEIGSVATAFRRTGGTLAGELSLAQRYFYNINHQDTTRNGYNTVGSGFASSATNGYLTITFPTSMRIAPSSLTYTGTFLLDDGVSPYNITNITLNQAGSNTCLLNVATTGLTTYRPLILYANNDTNARLSFSAEL